MLWVVVFGSIALAALVMLTCLGLWLWRKSIGVMGEVAVLAGHAETLAGLLEQIELPERGFGAQDFDSFRTGRDGTIEEQPT